jgi:hypothetical protein
MKQLFTLTFLFLLLQTTIAQNVGIGTTTPKAHFNVANNKTVLFGADTSGGGSKLIWYSSISAFRAGLLDANSDKWNIVNVGKYSFAAGLNTVASGYGSTATGNSNIASADYSFASGSQDTAYGYVSTAMGQGTAAFSYSTAMGSGSKAYGRIATAMGERTIASGQSATSMGVGTSATSYAETAVGSYNTNYVSDPFNWISTDRLFTIGNGQDVNTKSDALVILKNGNTGIGVSNPAASLNVGPNKTVLFGADTLGDGSKLIWYGSKSAFRAGFLDVNSDKWDIKNVGDHSFSSGTNTIASGYGSTAFGRSNTASGFYSFTAGSDNTASGTHTTAIGISNTASGWGSTAIGNYNNASGDLSTLIGLNIFAPSFAETTIGSSNTIYTPLNTFDWDPSDRLFTIGNGNANVGSKSDAMVVLKNGNIGFGSSNPAKKLEVVGGPSAEPVTLVVGNKGGFGPAALEFVSNYGDAIQWRPGYIQSNDGGGFTGKLEFYTNGAGGTMLYNSVKGFELTNGKAYTPTGTVFSFSDARLKNNITPFTDGLNVISKINPVQFYYNADAPFKTSIQQTGIIAQELEQVAPYMVEKNKEAGYEDLRSVNNQAYTFLLINAVKEQQAQIEMQQKLIEDMKSDNAAMKRDNLEMKKLINKIIKTK